MKYSVTIFNRIAIIDSQMRYTHVWRRYCKYFARTKKEAIQFASQHTSYYTKATIRKEVK